jgi:hypothetical protein
MGVVEEQEALDTCDLFGSQRGQRFVGKRPQQCEQADQAG